MDIISKNEFNEEIAKDRVLIDFYADWCGPCRMLSDVFESIKSDINIPVKKIDIDQCEDIAKKYGIMSIPCLIIFEKGNEVKRSIGYLNKDELIAFINNN